MGELANALGSAASYMTHGAVNIVLSHNLLIEPSNVLYLAGAVTAGVVSGCIKF